MFYHVNGYASKSDSFLEWFFDFLDKCHDQVSSTLAMVYGVYGNIEIINYGIMWIDE